MEPTKYLLWISHPYSWGQDIVLQYDSEEEAREKAKTLVQGAPGREDYTKVVLASVIEDLN
jgi:hypothetical protein